MAPETPVPPFGCPVCGLRLHDRAGCPNRWCSRPDRGFSVVFSVGAHQASLRHAISRFKYRREEWLADVFAAMVARYLEAHATWFEDFDVIGAVPGYCGPGAARSWDPLSMVLERLQVRIGDQWDIRGDLIHKTRPSPPMAGRTWADRRAIATGPLRQGLRPGRRDLVAGRRILLLDDVMAEGSTLREVACCLLGAGAEEVAGLVISRPGWSAQIPG